MLEYLGMTWGWGFMSNEECLGDCMLEEIGGFSVEEEMGCKRTKEGITEQEGAEVETDG